MLIPELKYTPYNMEEMRLDYSMRLEDILLTIPMQEQISALSEQDIEDNFNGFLIGVDWEKP